MGVELVGFILVSVFDQNQPKTLVGCRSARSSQPVKSHRRPDVHTYDRLPEGQGKLKA